MSDHGDAYVGTMGSLVTPKFFASDLEPERSFSSVVATPFERESSRGLTWTFAPIDRPGGVPPPSSARQKSAIR